MIRPTKYLDLSSCVLMVASVVIDELLSGGAVPLEDLDFKIRERLGSDSRFNFLPALNLLFLMGKLDYDGSADAVFLIRETEGAL